ncbi:hypothetical protein [Microbacterium sp.]|uniref:hypothetical protein n=1 Tax=Microbacterium sp. TaxID=51671 RepID=UPI003C7904A0
MDEPAPFFHVLGGEFPLCFPGRVHELPMLDHAWVRASLHDAVRLAERGRLADEHPAFAVAGASRAQAH